MEDHLLQPDAQRAAALARTCPSAQVIPGQCMAALAAARGGMSTPPGGCTACRRPWPCTACAAVGGFCAHCSGGFMRVAAGAAQQQAVRPVDAEAPPPPPPVHQRIAPRPERRAALLQAQQAGAAAARYVTTRR
jgi:hypothetical protein